MAGSALIIFADDSVTARVEGDLIKIDFKTRDADGQSVVTGTAVLTRFMATVMIADCYNKLKKDRDAPTKAQVLQFKRAERALAADVSLRGA